MTLINRERETRFQRLRESYEFSIVEALSEAVEAASPELDLILTETVIDAYNRHHTSKPTTPRSVGSALTRLGFRSTQVREQVASKWITRRGYRLNKEDKRLLESLKQRYGLTSAEPVSIVSIESSYRDGILPSLEREKSTPSYTDSIDTTATADAPKTSEAAPAGATEPSNVDFAAVADHTSKLTSYAWQRDHPKEEEQVALSFRGTPDASTRPP